MLTAVELLRLNIFHTAVMTLNFDNDLSGSTGDSIFYGLVKLHYLVFFLLILSCAFYHCVVK